MSEGLNDFPGFLSDIVRGTTRKFTIVVSENGVVTDITGAKFIITFAQDFDDQTAADLIVTIDPPTDPLNGETEGVITDDQTLALNADEYYVYSVRFVDATGAAYVVDMGRIKVFANIAPDVT